MRDFFKSDGYKIYRAELTKIIDNKTAQLILADQEKVPNLQAEVKTLVFIRDHLPKAIQSRYEEEEAPITEDTYGAPEEENVEDTEAPGDEYLPEEEGS